MKDLVLFGMPGAGKGTQAELIIQKTGDTFSPVSTGDIFRALLSKDNAIGRYAAKQMNQGQIVNDQVSISLFNAYFFTVLDEQRAMLLDGYPRSIPQMESFLTLCDEYQRDVIGIYFELSEEEAINRMMTRAREGEDKETMKTRLKEYYQKTHPTVSMFEEHKQLIRIDASASIEAIHEQVMNYIS